MGQILVDLERTGRLVFSLLTFCKVFSLSHLSGNWLIQNKSFAPGTGNWQFRWKPLLLPSMWWWWSLGNNVHNVDDGDDIKITITAMVNVKKMLTTLLFASHHFTLALRLCAMHRDPLQRISVISRWCHASGSPPADITLRNETATQRSQAGLFHSSTSNSKSVIESANRLKKKISSRPTNQQSGEPTDAACLHDPFKEQGRIHGYRSRVRVGRGCGKKRLTKYLGWSKD